MSRRRIRRSAQLNCWRWRGREHAVAVQQQHRDADELLDLDQRVLVVLVAVVLRRRGGEPGDVGQRFAAFLRQRRRLAGGQAETAEEAAAPVEQGAAAARQRRIGVGQQQFETEAAVLELAGAGLAQLVQRAVRRDRGEWRRPPAPAPASRALSAPPAASQPHSAPCSSDGSIASPELAHGGIDFGKRRQGCGHVFGRQQEGVTV